MIEAMMLSAFLNCATFVLMECFPLSLPQLMPSWMNKLSPTTRKTPRNRLQTEKNGLTEGTNIPKTEWRAPRMQTALFKRTSTAKLAQKR